MTMTTDIREHALTVGRTITGYRYSFTSESELQDAIAQVLTDAGLAHEREVHLSSRDRIDFLLLSGLGIEVKEIASSQTTVLRQLLRYAQSDRVKALALVTARSSHIYLPPDASGKPLFVVSLAGGSL